MILEFHYAIVIAKLTHENDVITVFRFFFGEKLPSKCTKRGFIFSY